VPAAVCNYPAGWTPEGTRMPEPTVRAHLFTKIDDLTRRFGDLVAEVREVTSRPFGVWTSSVWVAIVRGRSPWLPAQPRARCA
jgi:hypothetical protein